MNHRNSLAALTTLIFATMATQPARAEMTTQGSAYLGYGTYGADPDTRFLAVGRLTAKGDWQVGDATTFAFKSDLYLRSDHDDLSNIGDDWADIEASLSFGSIGTFGVSTYARCGAMPVPWVTGRVEQQSGVGVHARLGNRFRCIGADNALWADGRPQIYDTEAYFFYKNKFGRADVEIYWDPLRQYGPYSGDETNSLINMAVPGHGDPQPQLEARLSYAFDNVILGAGFNDQEQSYLRAIVPVKSYDLTLIAETTHQPISANARSSSIAADWRPKNMGALKSVFGLYLWDSTDENFVLSMKFGDAGWTLGLGADLDGNFGVTGSYEITDKLELVGGFDNGFDTGDGFDYKTFPPPAAAGREGAYEIGLRYRF